MSNLGWYQTITYLSKKVGGPKQLFVITAVGGYIIIRGVEIGLKYGVKVYKKKTANKEENQTGTKVMKVTEIKEYEVKKEATDDQGLHFPLGVKYRVLAIDKDSVLIEIDDNDNNPYFVSGKFLKTISDYNT